jgi:hypothetical protein
MSLHGSPFMFIRLIWDGHHIHFPLRIAGVNIKELHVAPETAHPFGRKGLALASAWKQLEEPDMTGLLILDGDVAIDPYDYMMMYLAIQKEPDAVHIAPTRLWPISKMDLDGWAWGHCRNNEWSQAMTDEPDFFAFNFTYIPRRVVELAISAGLKNTQFPHVDQVMSRAARQARVPMRVVEGCQPKHMHY